MPTVTVDLEQDVYDYAQASGDALPDKGGAAAYLVYLAKLAFEERATSGGFGDEINPVGNEPF